MESKIDETFHEVSLRKMAIAKTALAALISIHNNKHYPLGKSKSIKNSELKYVAKSCELLDKEAWEISQNI